MEVGVKHRKMATSGGRGWVGGVLLHEHALA